ncbi:MAG: hypothetical protein JXR37_19665 [Kiritimatiellae bacterium]|nr:hypothetical protein [Kiritimatiellia bacterium]
MAKALRVFIILGFLLSIGALVLGIMLFNQREILKGRTQKLENCLLEVAKTIETEREGDAMVSINKDKLMTYDDMQGQLDILVAKAVNQRESLEQTRNDLDQTNEVLRITSIELKETKQQLADARAEITRLNGEIATLNSKIDEQRRKIAELEQEKSELKNEIEELNTKITKLEEEIEMHKDEIQSLKNDIARLTKEEVITLVGVKRGVKGKVLIVNPDWNFVVFAIEADDIIDKGHNAAFLVQRGEQLVGRVKITAIKKNWAVADIQPEWQQMPIQEGDYVVYIP